LLGRTATDTRIYLLPAKHLLGFRLAPARCLPKVERALERELRPSLRREYRHAALCVVVVKGAAVDPSCAGASGTPAALLYARGTAGFGLVPDGVRAVSVTYLSRPPRTIRVRRNFFLIRARSGTGSPCGVQWLDRTGNVKKIAVGCSYLPAEIQSLYVYRSYVGSKLSSLRAALTTLDSDIGSGNLSRARSDWLSAHLIWLEIGQDDGAYGCFGALGGEIDGLAAGHAQGTADPGFTGFHRVELDLWRADLAAAARDTSTLQNLLANLTRTPISSYLPPTAAGVGNWVLRPHEVLEDALRDSMTADDDYGSGTDLASLTADVAAAREMLGNLDPVLDPLAPRLVRRARSELTTLLNAVYASRVNGTWIPVQSLSTRERQQIDADLDAALETLAPVPDLLTSTGKGSPD
jgi:hypothetical protein